MAAHNWQCTGQYAYTAMLCKHHLERCSAALAELCNLLWAIWHSSSSSEEGDSSDDDAEHISDNDGSVTDEYTAAAAEGTTATAGAADTALSETVAELDLTSAAGDYDISSSNNHLLVPHVNWTDDVLWNSDDDRSRKRRSAAAAAAASAPLLLTNGKQKSVDEDTLYESEDESGVVAVTRVPAVRYGKPVQKPGSKSGKVWAVTREPITINRDLSGGDWVKDIVWNDEQRVRPSKLILTQRDVDMLATVGKTARPVLMEKRPVGGKCTCCVMLSSISTLFTLFKVWCLCRLRNQ
jgi:hypothetical protein